MREAAGLHEVPERVGMERLPVRDVPDVALEERHPAGRVDRFENERSSGRQFVIRRFEKAHQVAGFEVLDDLNGDEAAQTAVALALEKLGARRPAPPRVRAPDRAAPSRRWLSTPAP